MTDEAARSDTGVTNGPEENVDPAARLASALCEHEASCAAPSGETPEGRQLRTQACMTDALDRTRDALANWSCSPAVKRARIEECLGSIPSALCENRGADLDRFLSCKATSLCTESAI